MSTATIPRTAKPSPAIERAPRPVVVATATALPSHRYAQEDLVRLALDTLPDLGIEPGVLGRFFAHVGVNERFLALPAERYRELDGLETRSQAWLEVATDLGEQALRKLLGEARVEASEIGELMTTTVTGLAVPTLDARLMNRISFPLDLKRVPLFGLGCVGGAAGVARVADYLEGHPDELAILLAVELCSLTLQRDDVSVANVISMGLFGDGAAAVLLAGADHPLADEARPRIVATRSAFFPDTERMMGWDIVDGGFKVVLSPEVPELAETQLPEAVDAFLGDHGLRRDDIGTWVTHPGGPKIMDAVEKGLELTHDELEPAREGLADVGNLSSASVLFLLDDYRRRRRPAAGTYGLMMAMGPAFCAELVLLEW
jgi:alkylresorcinol/alkylpyrone synthase